MPHTLKDQFETDLANLARTDLRVRLYDAEMTEVAGLTVTVGVGEQHTDYAVFPWTMAGVPTLYVPGQIILDWEDDETRRGGKITTKGVERLIELARARGH